MLDHRKVSRCGLLHGCDLSRVRAARPCRQGRVPSHNWNIPVDGGEASRMVATGDDSLS